MTIGICRTKCPILPETPSAHRRHQLRTGTQENAERKRRGSKQNGRISITDGRYIQKQETK